MNITLYIKDWLIIDQENNLPKAIKRLLKFNISSIISIYINIHNLIINSFYYCQNYVSLFKLISSFIYCSLKLTLQLKLNYKNNANIIKLLITLNLIDQNLLTSLSYLKINRNTRKSDSLKLSLKWFYWFELEFSIVYIVRALRLEQYIICYH